MLFRSEIWWVHIGKNIGVEENGKGVGYSRPVLVVRRFSDELFWGVALTTKRKSNTYYYPTQVHGRKGAVIIRQLRAYVAKRLNIGRASCGERVCQYV